MNDYGIQDAYLIERAVDPTSAEFDMLMGKLLTRRTDDRPRQDRLQHKGEFRYMFPYRGDSEMERQILDDTPFVFAERSVYRNGVTSLAYVVAEILDLISLSNSKSKFTNTLCVSGEAETIHTVLDSAHGLPSNVMLIGYANVADSIIHSNPQTMVVDHTTIPCSVEDILNLAYRGGVQIVEGVFPYHASAVKGWDAIVGNAKWSYSHSRGNLTVGPDDDPSRLMVYKQADYRKFLEPALWEGKCKEYLYEIRKYKHGLATYRAVYTGGMGLSVAEPQTFRLPMTSADDMILITINKDLAAGVFSSLSNNASELSILEKNYCLEVRRDLFTSCVDYLISKEKGADVIGESIRYISNHNYVDLVDGVRIVRCASLSYADALCVAMVCTLTAYMYRYRLTSESYDDVVRTVGAAKQLSGSTFGSLGRLAWLISRYIEDRTVKIATRAVKNALSKVYSTDYIPGVCYDVYMDVTYVPDLPWYQAGEMRAKETKVADIEQDDDAFVKFLGGADKTYAPTIAVDKPKGFEPGDLPGYAFNIVSDPEVALQEVYDKAFPGNSTAQVQNAAELRRVKDVNLNTEFFGKVEINKDKAAPERLHQDLPLRTTTLPVSNTPLLDAMLACAKRNFNPPDLQLQSDPWKYADSLVDRFISRCFVPNYSDTLEKKYRRDPISFNVTDYLEWKATRDKAYRSALEAECPAELVELGLEKYDTIVKQRIKPKLSTSAQYELDQPQVIVSNSKKDTALFTSVFRKIFERFDECLVPQFKSAGRLSDAEISAWLTDQASFIRGLKAIELDSSKYDKSQNLLARLIESVLFVRLGLDPGVAEIFKDSYVGKVSSRNLGLMFISALQMKSGGPDTMLGNIIYDAVSAGESVGWNEIQLMILKGDDNIIWLKNSVDTALVVSKMSGLFNLEVKLISDSVLYFSSGYIIDVADRIFFVSDPLKIITLLGEGGARAETKDERYTSFVDRVRWFSAHAALPMLLQSAVRRRTAVYDLNVVLAVDALLSMASSRALYDRVVRD